MTQLRTDFTWWIRRALVRQGICGADGGEISHIELFGPPQVPGADSKNFILCLGGAYDRSSCGTVTSATPDPVRWKSAPAPEIPW